MSTTAASNKSSKGPHLGNQTTRERAQVLLRVSRGLLPVEVAHRHQDDRLTGLLFRLGQNRSLCVTSDVNNTWPQALQARAGTCRIRTRRWPPRGNVIDDALFQLATLGHEIPCGRNFISWSGGVLGGCYPDLFGVSRTELLLSSGKRTKRVGGDLSTGCPGTGGVFGLGSHLGFDRGKSVGRGGTRSRMVKSDAAVPHDLWSACI